MRQAARSSRMRAPLVAAIILLTVGCSQGGGDQAGTMPRATPSSSPIAEVTAKPCTPTSSYGLLIVAGSLQAINTCGKVAASATIAPSSAQVCSPGGLKVNIAPPVSATKDRIYFRN